MANPRIVVFFVEHFVAQLFEKSRLNHDSVPNVKVFRNVVARVCNSFILNWFDSRYAALEVLESGGLSLH